MNSVEISILAFSLVFGGALLGIYFGPFLGTNQLKAETRSHVQWSVGLLTSMFALLLSLQLSSGKTHFDTQEQDVSLLVSKALTLDRVLLHYGPEAQVAREALRKSAVDLLDRVWPSEQSVASSWVPTGSEDDVYDKIQALSPKDEKQRSERMLALEMAIDLGELQWKSATTIRSSTSVPLMIVEIAWATIIFVNLGLLAPRNATVIVSLAVCASAVSGGFFLIAEMNTPFGGLLHASSASAREALKYLAR
jgi:hypothetical protein